MALTDTVIRKAKPKDHAYRMADGGTPLSLAHYLPTCRGSTKPVIMQTGLTDAGSADPRPDTIQFTSLAVGATSFFKTFSSIGVNHGHDDSEYSYGNPRVDVSCWVRRKSLLPDGRSDFTIRLRLTATLVLL